MKLQCQLYIDTSGNPLGEANFEKVDFFDFESIEMTSTIQDFRDISKVFTDYSKPFNLPASSNNNKIFRHYYNTGVVDGFDARIKQRAEIYLNGIFWKSGYVRLSKSLVSKGGAKSYNVIFFGGLTNLSNVIGDAELSDLSSLDIYNHDYNIDNVYNGFILGLQLSGNQITYGANRDIVYPSISANDKWYYDSQSVSHPEEYNQGESVNLYNNTGSTGYGINWLSLKPAIKVKHIISAIESKYSSINFSKDFFGTAEFDDLYMLLHNNKGTLAPSSSTSNDVSLTYRVGSNNNDSDFNLDAGQTEIRPLKTYWENASPTEKRVFQYHLIIDVSNTVKSGGGSNSIYTIEVLDGGVVIDRFENVSGDTTVTSVLCTENVKEWTGLGIRISSKSNELSIFELDLDVKRVRYKIPYINQTTEYLCDVSNFGDTPFEETTTYSTSDSGTQTMVRRIEITRNMPKMKVLDFLSGIFKMFNLTAKVGDDGIINVKTLNEFYSDGGSTDITSLAGIEDVSVNRMDLFRNIEFKYSENKTFGIINNNEISQTDYGNLSYQATADGTDASLVFDGKDYKVKLPFEKMYYERLSDENNLSDKTEMGHGWLVDKDQNEVITKPILFFNIPQPVDSSKYEIGFLNKPILTRYNRASNTNAETYWTGSSWYTAQGTKSINFNIEFDSFTGLSVSRGLFRKHYEDYISMIFDKGTRVFELEIKADLAFLLSYKINDVISIKGEEFLINNIKTNLTTGITKIELVLKFFIASEIDAVGATLTTPTGLTNWYSTIQQISFNWDENPSDQIVKGYKVYVDDNLVDTLLRQTSYTLSGLPPSTSYVVQVSAYNSQGQESSLSSKVTMSTTNVDSEPPTAPSSLIASFVSGSSIFVAYGASQDNVGVTGYEVYLDGVLNQTVTTLTANITGLSSKTTYEIYVRAKDAIPNYSEISNTITVRTL